VKVSFSTRGWEDYLWWQVQDRKLLKRVNALIADIARNGNGGIGKPELLRYLKGYWSRRINDEHRLVYRIADGVDGEDEILIAACRYHYGA
jgi:toxin YoeB